MDQKELHYALLDLAKQLDRTPSKIEFCSVYPEARGALGRFYQDKYTDLVLHAGLAPNKTVKVTNKIFERSIEKHIEQYEQQSSSPGSQPTLQSITPQIYPSIAVISDIHWPFENKKVITRFLEYVGDTKPQYAFLNGDAWDMYSHSKFPRSHNVFTPRDEMSMARNSNIQFWEDVQRISPKSECIQTLGNHDVRPLKRIIESAPEMEDWIAEKMQTMFTFPNVKTIFDSRQEVMLPGNIAIFHGYRTKLGDHRDFTLYNTINGHSHVGGSVFRKIRGQVLWELNSGLAGDPEAKGLTYTPQRITNWTPGFGAVDKYGPHFIHL